MSMLVNPFKVGTPAPPLSHFVVGAEQEGSGPNGAHSISMPGIQTGDVIILVNFCAFNTGSASITGGTSIISFGGSFTFGSIYYYVASSSDQTNQSIDVSSGAGASFALTAWRIGTTVAMPVFNWSDANDTSPQVVAGFTKNVAAKVEIFAFASVVNQASVAASGGAVVFQSTNKRLTFAAFDPSSTYANGTSETFTFASTTFTLSLALEIR